METSNHKQCKFAEIDNGFNVFRGEELVIQGAKKVNSSLPELGLKDVIPNGSWLEQKQIQSSLEARRHIIEVERIEKCGTLSQADWNDELQLAEVTKNAGGHWQYVGHNIGKQLYLYPEEALYLMEVSCLQLKYNDVTVSIQQAYSLLLKDNNSLIQYKVYASLSRLGYKVLRHTYVKANDTENDEAEDKLQDSLCSEKTCEVTDTSKENVETKSMNENIKGIIANEISEITNCQMKNISDDENSDSTKNAESKDNTGKLKSDETITVIAITGELKDRDAENIDMDKKKQENVKESHQIVDCQMNDASSVETSKNTETANPIELLSSSGQVCEVTGITEEQDNKGLDNKKEEHCAKVTDEITGCHMNAISINGKGDTNENIEAAKEVNKSFSSEHTCEVPDITEKQEQEEMNLKMEEDCAKETDKIDDYQITNSLNVENTDNNDMIEGSDKQKDHIENIKTDYKTEGCNVSSKDIIQHIESSDEQSSLVDIKENSKSDDCEIICMESGYADESKVSSSVYLCDDDFKEVKKNDVETSEEIVNSSSAVIIQNKIEILTCRELKPSNSVMVDHCITENLPDFYQKQVVTIKAPDEQLIPRNVFLNNTAYVLNLENLKLKSVTPAPSSSTQTYSVSDEANEQHVRRIGGAFSGSTHIHFNPQFFPNMRFPQRTPQFRPYTYWNQYHWSYPRPFFTSLPFRFQFLPRMQPMFRCIPSRSMIPNLENADSRRARKRKLENPKRYHLESIKKLALKLKSLVASGNRQEQNIQALQRLIDTYNVRYKARIELTPELDIVENEIILETINLDDDDQSSSKKKKREEMESYDENFNALNQFSVKIKDLEAKKILTTRHKRAFSNVVKTFNKSYNADVYFDSNYDIIDRRRIVIASSSDSDCAVEEIQTSMEDTSKPRKSKKLRNPFYILKQLSEKQSPVKSSQDVVSENSRITLKKKFQYSDHLKKMFSKYWLPSEDDFGRAEVPLRSEIRNQMDNSEEFLYQFIKSQSFKFNNWLEAKIAYWQSCKEAALKYEAHTQNESIKLDCIIKPEDCTDLRNVLTKLSIIKTATDVEEESSLSVHFDVYNRDVANFKKTKKPTPHFRVICIAESSTFPCGVQFATLHSKYDDNVVILFAIVGTSSIAYLQMNPVDLPLYLPSNNLS
ncbi:uncharacterized protein LOC134650770 [Cydia amplana]|uniref:uncharacterized protein LOC134650770 n=1 Tax=Cydia amplana TaxID=1869771 RepID=UPI002FE6151D